MSKITLFSPTWSRLDSAQLLAFFPSSFYGIEAETGRAELFGDLGPVKTMVSELFGDLGPVKTMVSELFGDLGPVKTMVSELFGDLGPVKTMVSGLSALSLPKHQNSLNLLRELKLYIEKHTNRNTFEGIWQ